MNASIIKQQAIWLNGDKLQLLIFATGESYIINDKDIVQHAWQTPMSSATIGNLHLGDKIDRPYKLYGIPSRHLHLDSGEYLAYDHLGIAFHLLDNKVNGWFLYQP